MRVWERVEGRMVPIDKPLIPLLKLSKLALIFWKQHRKSMRISKAPLRCNATQLLEILTRPALYSLLKLSGNTLQLWEKNQKFRWLKSKGQELCDSLRIHIQLALKDLGMWRYFRVWRLPWVFQGQKYICIWILISSICNY